MSVSLTDIPLDIINNVIPFSALDIIKLRQTCHYFRDELPDIGAPYRKVQHSYKRIITTAIKLGHLSVILYCVHNKGEDIDWKRVFRNGLKEGRTDFIDYCVKKCSVSLLFECKEEILVAQRWDIYESICAEKGVNPYEAYIITSGLVYGAMYNPQAAVPFMKRYIKRARESIIQNFIMWAIYEYEHDLVRWVIDQRPDLSETTRNGAINFLNDPRWERNKKARDRRKKKRKI